MKWLFLGFAVLMFVGGILLEYLALKEGKRITQKKMSPKNMRFYGILGAVLLVLSSFVFYFATFVVH